MRAPWAALLSLLGALGLAPASALAQPVPPAEAQALFKEATEAMGAKDFASACPKLERVVQIVPDGIGAKLALGDCYVGGGKLASAYRVYGAAEAAAGAAHQDARQKEARSKADSLAPRLAKLTLNLGPDVRGLAGIAVSRNGVPLSMAELGAAVAVDAGEQVIVVSADGRKPGGETLRIADGEKRSVQVDRLDVAPSTDAPRTQPPPPAPREGGPRSFWSGQRVAGVVVGVVGVAGLGIGGALGGVAKSRLDESNGAGGCDQETDACSSQRGVDLRSQALTFAHASTAAFIVGGALLGTGIIVFTTAPRATVDVAAGPTGAVLRGRY